jgi:aromatic ring-cleaving dioxygenase
MLPAVEDTAILDASMDVITSRKVRDKMKLGHSVEQLVGDKINDYVQIHHLGAKVGSLVLWLCICCNAVGSCAAAANPVAVVRQF